jgi:hypothetical protein
MNSNEDMHLLEAELEISKRAFHQDVRRIGEKLREARARLNPMNVVVERPLLISGFGLLLGFMPAHWDLPLGEIGKPLGRIT